jgi:hypothetical protein
LLYALRRELRQVLLAVEQVLSLLALLVLTCFVYLFY